MTDTPATLETPPNAETQVVNGPAFEAPTSTGICPPTFPAKLCKACRRAPAVHVRPRIAWCGSCHERLSPLYAARIRRKAPRYTQPRDAAYRSLVNTLRTRLYNAFQRTTHFPRTIEVLVELVGCTPTELAARIEAKFQPGMTWDNHGIHGWHIDHIRPCAAFDLRVPDQRKQCFHYTNLQPLWSRENVQKGTLPQAVYEDLRKL